MKLKVKSTAHNIKAFILVAEWIDKSEKDPEKKKKKFLKEVKANDQFEVPDELGHRLMSKYEDNLDVINYGKKEVTEEAGVLDEKIGEVPENKMAKPKETK